MPRLIAVDGPESTLGWLLVAVNGRQVARSVTLYRTEEQLDAALREMSADRKVLRYGVRQSESGMWAWTAFLPVRRVGDPGGSPIACSARGYLRRDQCRQGVRRFAAALDGLAQGPSPLSLDGRPSR